MLTRIYWIEENFGIMSRPLGGDMLSEEIINWKKIDIKLIVSLLTEDENEELGLELERSQCTKAGFEYLKFPIDQSKTPDSILKTKEIIGVIQKKLSANEKVLIHGRACIGRVGLLSSCVLISKGLKYNEAIEKISNKRGLKIPDTDAQLQWIKNFEETLK